MNTIYYSTNRQTPEVDLATALLTGQAPDKGLYMPRPIPKLERAALARLAGKPYPEIAWTVLRPFAAETVGDEALGRMCEDAYNYPVPLERVIGRRHVMRLDQGPTASFKDFAGRMMGRLISRLVEARGGELLILTATSGDTGSAIAHAFHRLPRIGVVVLFPRKEVSDRQRKQMTTLGHNVATIAVDGKFDDCQALVKEAFADPALRKLHLSSANSINIGRLLPQAVYYVYAWAHLADAQGLEPILFSVPSGNFGDLMGGVLAREMGLPVQRFVVATNANDEVPRFFETGDYRKIVPSRVCLSNAMNVGHPSNLARLVDLYGGWMDEIGIVKAAPDLGRIRRDFFGVSVDDEGTRRAIIEAWKKHKLLLEPHGAVGWAGLERYLETGGPAAELAVSIETAHPAKFPDEIQALLHIDPALPKSLEGLDAKPEHFGEMEVDYAAFRDYLEKEHAS